MHKKQGITAASQKRLQLCSKGHRSSKHFNHLFLTKPKFPSLQEGSPKEKAILSATSACSLNLCKDLYIFVAGFSHKGSRKLHAACLSSSLKDQDFIKSSAKLTNLYSNCKLKSKGMGLSHTRIHC